MVKIEINGQMVEAEEGSMLIDVADQANIAIPRFCYHKKLSIAANCRMCLVEVEGAPKALPACATPVTDGMKVLTKSPKAQGAQKNVMEFLLINHPLDCPICDQGGECELQDVAFEYGEDVSHFNESKRVVADKDVGSLIETDMTRCIHCTRCVRFGQEVAGMMELGATGRSEWMEIGTYIEKSISSEMSGNMIDLCPVGALTSKPFRYSARPWELQAHPMIAPHDSVGSNMMLHTKGQVVKRVVPAENESVNEVWLSDRDRFSYESIHSEDRLTAPMIKDKGQWREVSWDEALAWTAKKMAAYAQDHPDHVGMLISPTTTTESLYLFQQLAQHLNITNLDHRLLQRDFDLDHQATQGHDFPFLATQLSALEQQHHLSVIGGFLRKEVPLINHRLRKATQNGGQVWQVNPQAFDYNFDHQSLVGDAWISFLAEAVHFAKTQTNADQALPHWVTETTPSDAVKHWVSGMIEAAQQDKAQLLIGQIAQIHADYSVVLELTATLANLTGAQMHIVPMQSNTVGAHALGVLPFADPNRPGKHVQQMLTDSSKMFFNFGFEPEKDMADSELAVNAMRRAEFVVNCVTFDSELQRDYADVLLPLASFAETAGSYVNANGQLQTFKMAIEPLFDSKPGWKVLRVLGNLLQAPGFEFNNTAAIRDALPPWHLSTNFERLALRSTPTHQTSNTWTSVGIYQTDAFVRRAPSLQATPDAQALQTSE